MSPSGTMYAIAVALADADREVYADLKLQLAQHPSESSEYLVTRLLGYCLEYREGITFTRGLSESEEPAVWAHDLTGQLTLWLEIGSPRAARLHKASKAGAEVVVYTYKSPAQVVAGFGGERIHGAEQVRVVGFAAGFVAAIAAALEKRIRVEVSVSGGEIYVNLCGTTFTSTIETRRASEALTSTSGIKTQ